MQEATQLRRIQYVLAAISLLAYMMYFNFASIVLFPFVMTPVAINVYAAYSSKNVNSQIVLLFSTVAYAAWVCFICIDVSGSTDGQAGLVFIFAGILASPMLLILWITCIIINSRQTDPILPEA